MAINFPTSLDSLTNPQGTDSVQAVSHAAQHADANDAIEALEAKVGADNSTVTTSLDYRINALENASLDEEGIQQIAADLLTNGTHTNIVVTYDNANDKINLEATYGDEEAIDAIATALTTGTGITKTYNQNPPNYIGDYDNGAYYSINDVVSIPAGSPYGIVGSYFIRSGNAGNPGYPPEPGGATNASWTLYVFSPTITIAVDTNSIATQSYVTTAISNIVDSAPGLLDTLNEIAAAIGDDANFATTITNALALKAPLASPDLTGTPTAPTATAGTNTTQIATTAFVKTATDSAVLSANEYTDDAVAGLGNSLPSTYVPISDVGNAGGVASLGLDGKVPSTELDIDPTIQSVAAAMITGGTHTNLSVTYDNVNKLLNFTAQGGGGANVSISASAPASPNSGDLWLDSDTATLYAYDGAFWVEISGAGGGGGGGGSGNFILSETAPTSPSEGDTWFDTANAKLYVYYDSFWIEAIATGATGPTGPMFLDYQGAWNSSVGYVNNEGVTYNGSLWRLNSANSPAGTTPSTPNWQLIVQKGDKGDTSELSIGTITTVPYGTPANVTNTGTSTDAIFNFTLPSGPRSTIAIGDVTDVDFGTPPTVTNVGTTSDAVFDFELTTGRASTVTVGTVTTADYSDPATVTNIGTTSDAIFNFSIPQGVPGEFNVSPTAPVNPVEGNVWYNSTNGRAYVYYDNYWVEYAIGPTGATGPMFLDYQGHWDPLEDEYVRYDGVSYNGSLWILNSATSNAGQIPSTPNWTLVVQKGDKGDAAATVQVGTTTTIAPGNPASVTNSGNTSDAVFNFSIPSGPAATIAVGDVNDVVYGNPPTVTNSGNTSAAVFDFEIPAGRAATVNVGAVTTVVDGNPATVTNSGDTSDAVFNFQIPAGPRSTIAIGDVTDVDFGTPPTVTNVGTTSDAVFDFELTTGRASTLAVGTVTTGSYSSQASITNVGTSSDAVFNFSIPQGIPGDFNVGVNPPANPLTGHIWYNSNTGRAYIYYDGYWVEFSPGFVGPQGPAGSGLTPEEISANTTLSSGYRYFVDTTASRTLTLPASPVLNDEIEILDSTGSAGSNNIILDRNLNKINGTTSNLTINTNGSWTKLVFTGSVYGWKAV